MNGTALASKEVHNIGEVTTAGSVSVDTVDNGMEEDIAVVGVVTVVVDSEEGG